MIIIIQLSFFFLPVCSNTSSTYQAFSLNSPLIISVTSNSQLPAFQQGREVSPTNPIEIPGGTIAQPIITFSSTFQLMEVTLQITKKVRYFYIRSGATRPTVNYTSTSITNQYYDYLITVPPSSQSTTTVFLVISTEETANITGFTIKACTGKISSSFNFTNILFYITF